MLTHRGDVGGKGSGCGSARQQPTTGPWVGLRPRQHLVLTLCPVCGTGPWGPLATCAGISRYHFPPLHVSTVT